MFSLKKRRREPIGLDISDLSLKLVALSGTPPNISLAAYAEAKIPQDVLVGDNIKNPEGLAEIIRAALKRPQFGRITSREVVASIPETKSFVRVIQVPVMTALEAREAIPFEAEAYIPLPINQVYLDWVILSSLEPGTPGGPEAGKMTVLLTASPKDYIDRYVKVIKAVGLEPLALEVESQATARSLVPLLEFNETVLIMDLGGTRTSLTIFDRGVLEFTSSVAVAGNAFTESLARALSLDLEQAEELKRKVGLDEAQDERGVEVRNVLLPQINNLVEEIKNTIRFYEEHAGPAAKISRILLSGGSSKLRNLPDFLQAALNLPQEPGHELRSITGLKIELGNPWLNVASPQAALPMSAEDSLSFATAIGLALRGFEE